LLSTDQASCSSNFRYRRKCARRAVFVLALLVPALVPASGIAEAQESQTSERRDVAVRIQMRNVHYRFEENIAVQIKFLSGALIPVGDNDIPFFDDKHSFKLRVDSAEISIRPADLANLLNAYVFARRDSPLVGISVAVTNSQLKIKGKLRDKGDIPFETQSVLSATQDGRIRLHSEKIKALHVPVKGLMDAFGLDLSTFIKSGKVPGVQAEDDDLILDLQQILPPPHIEGKVTSARVDANSIVQIFGQPDKKPVEKFQRANYFAFKGNRLRFGRLTMTDTDMVLYDLDPGDPFDFFLDHYKEQLAAGYSKTTVAGQLRGFMKDYDKLAKPKQTREKPN
jgi:hypothetical protein